MDGGQGKGFLVLKSLSAMHKGHYGLTLFPSSPENELSRRATSTAGI